MQPSPYAPPRDPNPNAPMGSPRGAWQPFVSPKSSGNLALVLTAGVVGISVLLRIIEIVLFAAPPLVDLIVAISRLLGLANALMRVGAAISILLWVSRTAKNVRALGWPGLSIDPTLCVLCFFIPLANLVMPGVAVSQIARASQREPKPAVAAIVWWGAYVAAVISSGGARVAGIVPSTEQLTYLFIMNCFVTVFYVVSFAALYVLVRRIDADQDARALHR